MPGSLTNGRCPTGGLEIIVVDNASSDGSLEMVREKYPAVRLIASAENRGFSAANNPGRGTGQRPIRCSSSIPIPASAKKPWCSRLPTWIDIPDVGAITVRLVYPNGERDPDNHRGFPTPWNALCHFSGLGRLFPGSPRFNGYFQSYADFEQTHAVPVIAGSFMMMPRAVYDELGGWDETYFFYGEDIDICYRIQEAGYEIVYYPHVEVLHYKGASSGLRKESAAIAHPPKETRVKVARESSARDAGLLRKVLQRQVPPPGHQPGTGRYPRPRPAAHPQTPAEVTNNQYRAFNGQFPVPNN